MKSRLALGSLFAVALLGCSDATGSVVGGDSLMSATGSSSSGGDGGGSGDGGMSYVVTSAACLPGGANAGNTWTDLYTCYFGPAPAAVASCSLTPGGCHGATGDPGAGLISNNYVCSPTDATACYTAMTKALISPNTTFAPTTLFSALRSVQNPGAMPLVPPTLTFQDGVLARISAWIAAGAANN